MKRQKDIFFSLEGDAWLFRNHSSLETKHLPQEDPVLSEIVELPPASGKNESKVLEIGCSDGYRLEWLKVNKGCKCSGIEPSKQAVEKARQRGLDVYQGTADSLSFPDETFNTVIFGFCLYLCDREDLFRIAYEADRVLRNPGWMIIHDFFSPSPVEVPYHHVSGLFSFKMDYRTLFTWHPAYTCLKHKIVHHDASDYTDDRQEWVATSVLRKCLSKPE